MNKEMNIYKQGTEEFVAFEKNKKAYEQQYYEMDFDGDSQTDEHLTFLVEHCATINAQVDEVKNMLERMRVEDLPLVLSNQDIEDILTLLSWK